MKTLGMHCFLLFLLVLAKPCSAQLCMQPGDVQADSGYSFIRTEVKALQWMRKAVSESQKIQPILPARNDPKRVHAAVEFYTAIQNVSDDYDCSKALLSAYKDSKNESIHNSVEYFLQSIDATKEMNAHLLEMTEALDKVEKLEDLDEADIGKKLALIKSVQKDAGTMAMAAAKMSTFGILRVAGDGDGAKPSGFTITAAQRETLLAEVRQLAKQKTQAVYVDNCAEILLDALIRQLPTSTSLKRESDENGIRREAVTLFVT